MRVVESGASGGEHLAIGRTTQYAQQGQSMGRPHTEFIQCQSLEWQQEPLLPGAWQRLLSRDDESGARTLVSKLEPGVHFQRGSRVAAGEEFFVLAGSYYVNGYEYSPGCYGYFPPGHPRRDGYSAEGAVLLRFFDAEPRLMAMDEPAADVQGNAIECLDTYRMVWDRSVLDHRLNHLAGGRKILRVDPVSGQKTFLYMTAPQTHPTNWRGVQEQHPTPEEAFLIAGDLTGEYGTMRAGAYFWRPPRIPHGPFGSRTGSFSLIRFVGGAHVNEWGHDMQVFDYNRAYTPVLPAELAKLAVPPPPIETPY